MLNSNEPLYLRPPNLPPMALTKFSTTSADFNSLDTAAVESPLADCFFLEEVSSLVISSQYEYVLPNMITERQS